MKNTINDLNEAILTIADSLGKRPNYEALMLSYCGFPKIIEMIVYEMYINDFHNKTWTNEVCLSNNLVSEYAKELSIKGWVDFSDVVKLISNKNTIYPSPPEEPETVILKESENLLLPKNYGKNKDW